MKTAWTAGLKEQEKKEVVEDFKASPALRARLTQMLTKKIDSERTSSLSKISYDSPSWPYLQADTNGYERALREVISLIDEEKVEKS